MLSHITSDLHQAYLEEVFKPQLGKPGASEPERSSAPADLDNDGNVDSFEKKVRQFIYDVRHIMRKKNVPVERAFEMRSSTTNYGAGVIKTAKEKLGIKTGGVTPVSEEVDKEKLYSIVINYKNGTTYRKRTSRSEINRLRSNPNVSSVEMTRYGVDGLAKKDYDRDGKIESGSKEHAGAVHNAIQRATGGTPDGQDTRRKTSKKKLKGYGVSEGFSNWRQDLKEVIGVDDEIASRNEKQIKEKKVDNYGGGKNSVVKINPEFTESVNILGGYIVESFELNEEYLNETANLATEFFYNYGLNENGVEIVIEELGVDKFSEFVFDLAEEYFLSEARAARKRKGGKSYEEIKAEIDAREKEKAATRKKITASKAKEATEKAKETQAPSSEKSPEGTKTEMGKGILGALTSRAKRDTELLKKSLQTAREVGRSHERRVARAAGTIAGATVGAARVAHRLGQEAAKSETGKAIKRRLGVAENTNNRFSNYLKEKAESEQQQKLFGLALSVKRGQTPRSEASPEVLKIVDSMSEKKIRDFAKTPHSEVPKKKK